MSRIQKILILLLLSIITITGCSMSKKNHVVEPWSETAFLMGTTLKITIFQEANQDIFIQAMQKVEDIENRMTINKEESEIIALNQRAGVEAVNISKDTLYVLERGKYYSELTQGLFDITIGPLVKLWNIGSEEAKLPEAEEIKIKLTLVNYQDIIINQVESTAKLNKPNMIADLGAIAKGYAADEVKKILQKNKVSSAIINLGGNILTVGSNPDGSPFRLGLQDPYSNRNDYMAIVYLNDEALVSSGIYERFFEEKGKRYHHILNPKTGYPEDNNLAGVSIITSKSIDADGLSTSIFLLGLEKGLEIAESLPDVEAIFLTKDKKVYTTSGVGDKLKVVNEEYVLVK